jgi:hypothetical protein
MFQQLRGVVQCGIHGIGTELAEKPRGDREGEAPAEPSEPAHGHGAARHTESALAGGSPSRAIHPWAHPLSRRTLNYTPGCAAALRFLIFLLVLHYIAIWLR